MNENIKKFLEKVARDPELTAKMRAVQDPDDAYRLASSVQDGFTEEEFISAMEQIKATIDASGTLSEDDIRKMAGGVDWSLVSSAVSGSAVSVSVNVGAASAAAI